MPFGLCNAPATFQRMMDTLISPSLRAFCRAYVDDVLVHSDTFEDHLKHIDAFLQRLIECGLTVKLSKLKLAQKIVKYLGCKITHGQLRPDFDRVQHISKWDHLASVKSVRMFLGLANYPKFYREFQ